MVPDIQKLYHFYLFLMILYLKEKLKNLIENLKGKDIDKLYKSNLKENDKKNIIYKAIEYFKNKYKDFDIFISRIKEDLSYRPELALKEVAERNRFLSASNFSDFCNQQVLKTPGELKKEGYEEWCERRMKYWNSES